MDIDRQELTLSEKFPLTDIDDLAKIYNIKYGTKYIGVLLYMSLHFLNTTWKEIDEYLKDVGLMNGESCHKWATVFINGDYEEFSNDLRDSKQDDSFYDTFPEIEADGKAFVVQTCSQNQVNSMLWIWLSLLMKNNMN